MLRLLKISMLPGPVGGVPAWAMLPKVTSAPVAVTAARPPAISRLGDRDVRDAGAPTAPCPPPRPPCWVGRVLVIAYSAVPPRHTHRGPVSWEPQSSGGDGPGSRAEGERIPPIRGRWAAGRVGSGRAG